MTHGLRVREATAPELEQWDSIVRGFPNYRLPHTRAWLEALVASSCGDPLYLVLEDDQGIVGVLPGLVRKVGRWRLFGSPLAGWQTVSLGPAFDPARFDTAAFAAAIVPYLEREHRIDHIELLHLGLDADAMRAAGFEGEPVATYRAPLFPGDVARTFKQLKDSARRNIKRARRLGLVVKFENDDSFVDEHYSQVQEVYRRGGYTVPFSRQRVFEFFQRLKASGNLVAVSVYLPGGRVNIATGLFAIEGKELLLWMWAHRGHYRWYRPTELMTWAVMELAVQRGCESLDFMGRGPFKTKFGAQLDETKMRWMRGRHRWLMRARDVARTAYYWQQGAVGRASRLARHGIAWLGRGGRVSHPARPPACVLGDIDLVRALGLARISSTVLAPPHAPVRYSRHTRAVFPWHNAWERPEELVDALVRFGQAQPEPPCLFYQEDRTLLLVSRFRDQLREAFRFVVPDAEHVEQMVDKARFQQLAQQLELPVPPARILDVQDGLPDDLGLAFPIVLKPVVRQNDRWEPVGHGGKAVAVANADHLRALWPQVAAANLQLIAQECIPGPETCIESYHAYVDERGHLVGEFLGRKIRTLPSAYGDSTALETTDAADVRELGRTLLLKRLKFRGVAKLDFKRGPDGRLHLLEINPRFNLWHHLGAVAGVNIPALVYGDMVGWPRPIIARAQPGFQWCKPWKDVAAARGIGVAFPQWLSWMLRCEAKSGFAWDDPFPFIGAALRRGFDALRPQPKLRLQRVKE